MIHSLVYRLGSHETILLITLDYHKAIILLLLFINAWIITPLNKYEFLFHIIFSFLYV